MRELTEVENVRYKHDGTYESRVAPSGTREATRHGLRVPLRTYFENVSMLMIERDILIMKNDPGICQIPWHT